MDFFLFCGNLKPKKIKYNYCLGIDTEYTCILSQNTEQRHQAKSSNMANGRIILCYFITFGIYFLAR